MFHIIQRRPGTRDGGALHRLESLKIYRNRFDLEDRRGATFIRTGPSNGIARRADCLLEAIVRELEHGAGATKWPNRRELDRYLKAQDFHFAGFAERPQPNGPVVFLYVAVGRLDYPHARV